jgi:hypothetical protein
MVNMGPERYSPILRLLPFVMRGKTYHLLKRAEIQARLSLPADQHLTHAESGITRALYDFPAVPMGRMASRAGW